MPVSKFDRFLPIAGVIAGVLALADYVPTGPDTPDDPKLTTYLHDHMTILSITAFAAGFACVAMLFFATGIRQAFRSAEPGESSYSSVAYAGAILVALSWVTDATLQLAALDAADRGHPDAVRAIAYVGEFGWLPWVTASAAMFFGTGIGGLRTSVLPKWLSIATIVLGVLCLLGPTGVLVFFVQPVWLIGVGVLLHRRLAPVKTHGATPSRMTAGV